MKSAIKNFIKKILYRPARVQAGPNSWVMLPRWLHNASRIHMGRDCFIGRFAIFHPLARYGNTPLEGRIVLGDEVYIGGFSQIHAMDQVEIGDGCVLSEQVYVSDISHGLNPLGPPIMQQPLESKGPVKIGKKVFIGYGCSVLPGVTLGDFCVVGTRSVVTRSFPAYSMIAGSPARLVKRFNPATQQWEAA